MQVNADGTILVATGSPDIGGSRASMALMAAETFGVDYSAGAGDRRRHRLGRLHPRHRRLARHLRHRHGGRRRVEGVVDELRGRAAMIWDVDAEGVIWEDGCAKPAGSNVGDFKPMPLKEIAGKAAATGGPITAAASVNAGGQAPGFSTQFCDVEVDPETGKVTILRFVAAQDVGKAIHPPMSRGRCRAASSRASAGR